MAVTDTLRSAETLRDAGVPDRQAVATASAIEDAAGDVLARVATREDLATLRADLYRLALIQAGVIVGAVVALLRLIP